MSKAVILGANGLPMRLPKPTPEIKNEASPVSSSSFETWGDLFGYASTHRAMTAQRAMMHSAVYACVRIIAGTIATLPLRHMKRGTNGYDEEIRGSELGRLLALRPNFRMSASMYWRTIVANMLLRGNGYAWLDRNRAGRIINVWPIPAERVEIGISADERLVYRLYLDDGKFVLVPQDDVLHFPGSMEWDGLRAKTPLSAYAGAVDLGIEAERFARDYFDNDQTPGGYISYEAGFNEKGGKTSLEQKEDLREYWAKMHGRQNRHKPAILTNGGKFNPLGINAEDAQLLETRRFQTEDIARIFGVPPHMIGAVDKTTSWGTGIEAQTIGFLIFTLNMHIDAIEQELEEKIHGSSGDTYSQFDTEGLTRADLKTRAEADSRALGGSAGPGWASVNEIRKKRNLPALEGDEYDKPQRWDRSLSATSGVQKEDSSEDKEPSDNQSDKENA